MNLDKCFDEIMEYAHFWNWLPDWEVAKNIYHQFPISFSVLTPFAYTYLEELIRSTTHEYGDCPYEKDGTPRNFTVGYNLIKLAQQENAKNVEYLKLLDEAKKYFLHSDFKTGGNNRNNVNHGLMPPRFWEEETFADLIKLIAKLSKYAGF